MGFDLKGAFSAAKGEYKSAEHSAMGRVGSALGGGATHLGASAEQTKWAKIGVVGAAGLAGFGVANNISENHPVIGTGLKLGLAGGLGYAAFRSATKGALKAGEEKAVNSGMKALGGAEHIGQGAGKNRAPNYRTSPHTGRSQPYVDNSFKGGTAQGSGGEGHGVRNTSTSSLYDTKRHEHLASAKASDYS